MSIVVPFKGLEKIELNSSIVNEAIDQVDLDGIVVLGYTNEGHEYFVRRFRRLDGLFKKAKK